MPPILLYYFYFGGPPIVAPVTPGAAREGFGVLDGSGLRDGSGTVSLGVRAGA
jgi:hypothetical protein